jgi:Sec-independent protein translocase protein TatA
MFGISWTEFLVIILVAICVVPVKNWPDVARFFGRVFKWVRNLVWKITDVSEQIQQRIDLEKPIDDLIANATNDIFSAVKPIKKKKTVKTKKMHKK